MNQEPRTKNYQPVIGLEVHVELKTMSKMFCGCSAEHFGVEPNTHTCPVCLGLPGALPIPNRKAIEWCVMIGLALNCEIPLFSKFDRKNYFYPDLPKGYQISQYDQPFAINGHIVIARTPPSLWRGTKQSKNQEIAALPLQTRFARNDEKIIRVRRVHMEEDTAKLVHQFGNQKSKIKNQNDEGYSLIDFNRSGVPLVEIVTEPDFSNANEVVSYLKKIQQIVRYLGVSDADMEKGMMRLEPNISLIPYTLGEPFGHPRGETERSEFASLRGADRMDSSEVDLPTYKVEVKNINSFRFVEKAINYEVERQQKILKSNKIPMQETRGWDEKKQTTVSQRVKEEAMDYRYFPEPDIPPIRWTKSQILNLKSQMPELPNDKFERFKSSFNLSGYDAEILTRDRQTADYFEENVKVGHEHNISPKQIANAIINKKIDTEAILPAQLIEQIVSSKQVTAIDEEKLEEVVMQVIKENRKAVEDYKKGKETVIMFFIGQVVRKLQQKIDAKIIKDKLEMSLKD